MRFATILALVLAGCAAKGGFSMSSDDNDPAALSRAFSREKKPTAGQPMNATGKPLAFVVSAVPRQLIAYDLAARQQLWAVDATVTSRVAVGGRLVAAREGEKIVARSIEDGKVLWDHTLPPRASFLGLTADGERVFYTLQDDSAGKRTWHLVALEGGRELWRADAPGTLGAPAARGGLVYMPFLTQWLTILDGASGAQLARIRQTDEAINFVRATSDGVFYGGKGVFVLDDRSVKGNKSGATYGQANLPKEFVRTVYHFDAFSPVQTAYSAFDRNRVLWRATGGEGGKLAFTDGLAVVFSFRFFFAFDAVTGQLRWAHQHARNDVVSVEHAGGAIFYVSAEGEIGAIDARTGGKLFQDDKRLGKRIIGASFDADGFVPPGTPGETSTVGVLAAIVANKDTRFNAVKLFATSALGGLSSEGQGVGAALLVVVLDPATPPAVYQKAADELVARKDKDALPALLEALSVKYDFLAGSKPRALEVLARAVGALAAVEAVPHLVAHLVDPATPMGALKDLADALGRARSKQAIPALRGFLLTYRADASFGGDNPALPAVIDALLAVGAGAEREVVQFVADDARTLPGLAEYARFALAQTAPRREMDGASK